MAAPRAARGSVAAALLLLGLALCVAASEAGGACGCSADRAATATAAAAAVRRYSPEANAQRPGRGQVRMPRGLRCPPAPRLAGTGRVWAASGLAGDGDGPAGPLHHRLEGGREWRPLRKQQ